MTRDFKDWLFLALSWVGLFYLVLLVAGCSTTPPNPCEQASADLGPLASELFTAGPFTIQTANGLVHCNVEI